jgi:hypothetical protein
METWRDEKQTFLELRSRKAANDPAYRSDNPVNGERDGERNSENYAKLRQKRIEPRINPWFSGGAFDASWAELIAK